MSKVSSAKIQMAESLLHTLIVELGPKDFAIALGNCNAHGEAFIAAGYERALLSDKDDSMLKAWHKAVEKLVKIGEEIEA